MLQLDGHVVDEREEEVRRLRDEIERLKGELEETQVALKNAKREASRAVGALRQQLQPLYRALQQVFGEIERVADDESVVTSTAATNGSTARWEAFKRRFPGRPSDIITALMELGPMNTTQLAAALKCDKRTIPNHIFTLNKAGVIAKNGGIFSLK